MALNGSFQCIGYFENYPNGPKKVFTMHFPRGKTAYETDRELDKCLTKWKAIIMLGQIRFS